MLPKLAIITTHPIQYNAPIFKMLTERKKVEVKVFYTWEQSKEEVYDPLFKRIIKWDLPLLEGYEYSFLRNKAKEPGSHHFWGINNPDIKEQILDYEPSAILVFGWSYISHLKVLKYFSGKIPIIFRGDSTLMNEEVGLKRLLRKLFLTWVYRHITKALFVGKKNEEYYLRFGVKPEQLVFAPHAVENDRFQGNSNSSSQINWREKLMIPESATVLLFAGKFEPRKNPFLLISAFKELKSTNMHLVMVGNGDFEKELKQQSADVSNIHYLDFQNQQNMPSIYKMADVFVLPSKSETWGLAVNEAMACGSAVLVSDKCGCSVDLVDPGVNGYIFESDNKNDLLEKLAFYEKASKDSISKMGLASQDKIQEWSFESICSTVESLKIKNA
ncbi:glycosyltransferase [Pontibacter toksunensis]|uniref:Glycosyltransferase n=1 Tax=Pontibacter toksunensis TaxID=1332631 RepID=A0ABW6BQT3_9BACT